MARASSTTPVPRLLVEPVAGNRLDVVGAVNDEVALEGVGVGNGERSVGAGDLELRALQLRVEAEDALRGLAALELVERADVRRHRDVELLAGARARADDARLAGLGGGRAHAGHRAEQLHERGQVVRADVEQRAGALLEQEVGVGVPRLRAGATA